MIRQTEARTASFRQLKSFFGVRLPVLAVGCLALLGPGLAAAEKVLFPIVGATGSYDSATRTWTLTEGTPSLSLEVAVGDQPERHLTQGRLRALALGPVVLGAARSGPI